MLDARLIGQALQGEARKAPVLAGARGVLAGRLLRRVLLTGPAQSEPGAPKAPEKPAPPKLEKDPLLLRAFGLDRDALLRAPSPVDLAAAERSLDRESVVVEAL